MKLFNESLTYVAAQNRCNASSGELVILDSEDSRLWMQTLRNNNEGLWSRKSETISKTHNICTWGRDSTLILGS